MLTLPDYNVAMKPLQGRLLPFGWLKFLLGTRKIKTVRVLTLGIKRDYRMRGHPVDHVERTRCAACSARDTPAARSPGSSRTTSS